MTSIDLSTRTHVPTTFNERATLTQLLSYVRLTVHAKCVGLSQSDAVQTPLESSPAMSIAGLVSHLRWAEPFWIDVVFLGRSNQWPGTDGDSELQASWTRTTPDRATRRVRQAGSPHRRRHCYPRLGRRSSRPGRKYRQAVRVAVHHHAPDRGDRSAQRPPRHPPGDARRSNWRMSADEPCSITDAGSRTRACCP